MLVSECTMALSDVITVLCVENLNRIKSAAQTAHRANNPHRVLKSIMDMMKERYAGRNYESLSLEEILAAVELKEIKPDLKVWIQDALASNPKIMFYQEEGRYLFKPALGHGVCNRKQLLAKLCENERLGLGGLTLSDIKEAVYNHEKVLKVCNKFFLLLVTCKYGLPSWPVS